MSTALRIAGWQQSLSHRLGAAVPPSRRTPIGQLVKSVISSRTRDAVSLAAFGRLRTRFGNAAGIAAADRWAVERTIADVTFPDVKAGRLIEALRRIGKERPDYRLDHLAGLPIAGALADLERFPGVGRKTAASVLNFSTLARPVLVVDTHVARVLNRLGLPGDARHLSEAVTAAMPDWPAEAFVNFHVWLKHLGQITCRWDVPYCHRCPLAAGCETAGRSFSSRR
jgi:endonuclease III